MSLCEIGHSDIKQHVLIIKYKALILNTTLQYRILLKLIKLLDMSDNPKKKNILRNRITLQAAILNCSEAALYSHLF